MMSDVMTMLERRQLARRLTEIIEGMTPQPSPHIRVEVASLCKQIQESVEPGPDAPEAPNAPAAEEDGS